MQRGQILVASDDPQRAVELSQFLTRESYAGRAVVPADLADEVRAADSVDAIVVHVPAEQPAGAWLSAVRELAAHTLVLLLCPEAPDAPELAGTRAIAAAILPATATADEVAAKLALLLPKQSRVAAGGTLPAVDPSSVGLLGDSNGIRAAREAIALAARADCTVLILGASGTGKELAARALHAQSARASEPFVAVSCAAIPEPLLESELFGHAKGAFTDARQDRAGLMVRAGAGTLFLDEIGDMPLTMQVRLLRALQERRVRPVGSDQEVPFAARVLAATHRDLDADVAAGRFRQDLFFRINVLEIRLPPLRQRGRDVLLLAEAFMARASERLERGPLRLSRAAAARLMSHDWPGNVRELENCMERAVVYARGEELDIDDLPERLRAPAIDGLFMADPATGQTEAPGSSRPMDGLLSLAEMERRYILHVLRAVGGNRKLAAQILALDRSTLYRKLYRYGDS